MKTRPCASRTIRRTETGGAVWAGSDERAMGIARRIRTGQVDINGGAWNMAAPFGGYKQSGHGRENGVYGRRISRVQVDAAQAREAGLSVSHA